MTDVLALPILYRRVVTQFQEDGLSHVDHPFGGVASPQTGRPYRIVWIPGDPQGELGKFGPPKAPGRNPRPLATLGELFTLEISARDETNAEDPLAQYAAARILLDAWYRAAHRAAHGTFSIEKAAWVKPKNNIRRFGNALRVVVRIDAMIPDVVHELAPADATAEITAEMLDHTEVITSAPEPAEPEEDES